MSRVAAAYWREKHRLTDVLAERDDLLHAAEDAYDLLRRNPDGWNRYTAGAANRLEVVIKAARAAAPERQR